MSFVKLSNTGEFRGLSEKDVVQEIQKFSLLQICAKISPYFHSLRPKPQDASRNHSALSKLSYFATLHCEIGDSLPAELIDDEELTRLCRMINSLENDRLKPDSTPEEKFSFLLSIATNQQAYQFHNMYYGTAFWWYFLYDDCIKEYADAYFGIDSRDAFGAIFLILYSFNDNGYTSTSRLFETCKAEAHPVIWQILKRFSISIKDFTELKKSDAKYRTVDFESTSYSILRDFPILRLDDGYFLPISGLLIKKITDEIYYDLLRFNLSKGGEAANTFTEKFGGALQNLIDHYARLTLNPRKTKIISEFTKLKKGSPVHSADLHFLEKESLTLVQIKNRRAPLSVHWGNLSDYKQKIEESLIGEYEQNLKVIRDGSIFFSDVDGFATTLSFMSIVIHTEGFIYLNEEPIRTFIQERIAEKDSKFNESPKLNVFMDLLGYCNLMDFSLNTNKHIYKILQDYVAYQRNPQKMHDRLGNIIYLDFANWISIKSSSSGKKHPFYQKYSSELMNFAIEFAGNNINLPDGAAKKIREEIATFN